jgi:hypothetical protein
MPRMKEYRLGFYVEDPKSGYNIRMLKPMILSLISASNYECVVLEHELHQAFYLNLKKFKF